MDRYITWVRLGSYLLAGGTATLLASPAFAAEESANPTVLQLAAGEEGGEGEGGEGEGGEGGGPVEHYSLSSTDPNAFAYDAKAEIEGYADLVHESYELAYREAGKLEAAVDTLLADPSEATLAAARNAWINARPAYLMTETFRFYDGPIDVSSEGGDGPEGRINAWPMNEAVIDYVEGGEEGGLINDAGVEITEESILANDQVNDEADVTTGWHAIEFLLWGQDLSDTGPGQRPASDYLAGQGNNDRRRAYLLAVTGQLADDLHDLTEEWEAGEGGNYRETFLALPPREAIGRIMNGMAQLAGFELASERLAVALDSGAQEDEHSCFSDNTHIDHIHDLRGIRNVWFGSVEGYQFPGLIDLATKVDPVAAALVTARLNAAEAAVNALDRPFDRILASPAGSATRLEAERAVTALGDLAEALKELGNKLGVLVIIGG